MPCLRRRKEKLFWIARHGGVAALRRLSGGTNPLSRATLITSSCLWQKEIAQTEAAETSVLVEFPSMAPSMNLERRFPVRSVEVVTIDLSGRVRVNGEANESAVAWLIMQPHLIGPQ